MENFYPYSTTNTTLSIVENSHIIVDNFIYATRYSMERMEYNPRETVGYLVC